MIRGIAHVALPVSDLDRSIEFYTQTLGFKRAFDLHQPNGEILLTYLRVGGRQFLELMPAGQDFDGGRSSGHLCFEVEDLETAVEELERQGVEILVRPKTGRDGSRQAWIADPDRYRIELLEVRPESLQARSIENGD